MNNQGKITYNTKPEEKIVVKNIVPAIEVKTHFKPLKTLIVEDDEYSEKFITIRIKKFCKEIIIARTGVEAVEICQNNPDIDLVLMDIRIPEMNGYEAASQIRQFNKNVVIIAQTAYALLGDKEKAIEAGCNDYISKPILKDEFYTLIQKYFK